MTLDSGSGYIVIALNEGDGVFGNITRLNSRLEFPAALAAGDLYGDGWPDVCVRSAAAVNCFRNTEGDLPGFLTKLEVHQPYGNLVLDDINGDGEDKQRGCGCFMRLLSCVCCGAPQDSWTCCSSAGRGNT